MEESADQQQKNRNVVTKDKGKNVPDIYTKNSAWWL